MTTALTVFFPSGRRTRRSGGRPLGISTSGNSPDVLEALKIAREKGLTTIGSTGKTGGAMVLWCDASLVVPDDVTARIQEIHMLAAHIICQIIDEMDWTK